MSPAAPTALLGGAAAARARAARRPRVGRRERGDDPGREGIAQTRAPQHRLEPLLDRDPQEPPPLPEPLPYVGVAELQSLGHPLRRLSLLVEEHERNPVA